MQSYQTGARCVLAAICLVLGLGSCAARIPVDTQYVDESDDHARIVDLAFVTNRRLIDNGAGERYYSDKPGALSAGRCKVGFEEGSRRGEVLRVNTVPIGSVIPKGETGRIVIYIHGYGESFERNCRRGALLKDRLQLGDRLLLFSWPASNYLTYAQDIDDLAASLEQLNELLTELLRHVDAEQIVLMAHSLGSRGLVDALKRRDDGERKFSEAVFVAPDIRRDVFMEKVRMLQEKVSDITVYMSDNDRVLWLSATVNTSGRLGLAKEFNIDIDHISVIDVTPTGTTDISGHMYHMFNPAVVEDLRVLLGVPIDGDRREFVRVAMATPGFWSLEPVPHDE
jgi:esterase/lipase superfamily enzyme